MQNILREEVKNSELVTENIRKLAEQLYINENPNPQPFQAKIPQPTENAFTRIHQPPFGEIDSEKVQSIIDTAILTKEVDAKMQRKGSLKAEGMRIVPGGTPINALNDIFTTNAVPMISARRLEVMKNCINCIFERKISDARKTFPAVLRALKTKSSRLALTQELEEYSQGKKAILEHQQFDLIVRLMNCALQDESEMDVNGVANAMLKLAMSFCRRLNTGNFFPKMFSHFQIYLCLNFHDAFYFTLFFALRRCDPVCCFVHTRSPGMVKSTVLGASFEY